jgi:hypothetical protein
MLVQSRIALMYKMILLARSETPAGHWFAPRRGKQVNVAAWPFAISAAAGAAG